MGLDIRRISDKTVWDAFVGKYSPMSLFQDYRWGTVQERLGHTVDRWGYFSGKELCAVAQSIRISSRRGTFMHVRHGPVLKSWDTVPFPEILGHLRKNASQNHAAFLRISPLVPDNGPELQQLETSGGQPAAIHAMDAERCWVLDLAPTEEQLLAGMRKTTRYEIRRAGKESVEVRTATAEADIREFMKLYEATSQRHGFVGHSGVAEELGIMGDDARLYLGYHNGTLLAGAVILFAHGQAIYHHGASVPSKIPAAYLVQWEAIREAKRRGMVVYNFWGIAPGDKPDHPWTGLTLFKKGFGGREVLYAHARDYPVNVTYYLTRGVETVRRIRKGY